MKKTDLIKLTLASSFLLFAGMMGSAFAQSSKTDISPNQNEAKSGTLIANPSGSDAAKMKQNSNQTGNDVQNQPVKTRPQTAQSSTPAQSNKPLVTLPANATPTEAAVKDAPDSEAKKAKIAQENANNNRKSEQEFVNDFNNEAKQILKSANNYAEGKKLVWNVLQKYITNATPVLGQEHANNILNQAFENQLQLFQEKLNSNSK
jgi:hypothetical protein